MSTNQTIDMSPRESALYQAGEEAGKAKGLLEAAEYIAKIVDEMRGYAGAQAMRHWLDATAGGLEQQKRKPLAPNLVKALASSLRSFAEKSPAEMQEALVLFVARAGEAMKARAEAHRGLFAQHVARAGQIDRTGGIGTRIVKNIARRL